MKKIEQTLSSAKMIGQVVSAAPLSSEIIRKMENQLSLSTDKEVELKTEVDEAILGGFIIRLGDKILDASLKRQLEMIREEIFKEG